MGYEGMAFGQESAGREWAPDEKAKRKLCCSRCACTLPVLEEAAPAPGLPVPRSLRVMPEPRSSSSFFSGENKQVARRLNISPLKIKCV